MPDRALESIEGSIACLEAAAGRNMTCSSAVNLDAFANTFAFEDWSALLTFLHESVILLDKRTAQITRVLPTDMRTAWEFLADSKKLSAWMFPAEFESRAGAPFNFAPEGWHGKIGVFEEGRELRFDAVAGGWTWFSLDSIDGETMFKLRDYMAPDLIVPDDARTGTDSLAEEQPGGEGTHWQGVLSGWHCGVDDLRSEFSGVNQAWDYEALTRLYKILIEDYHRPY
ncbi:MAG: hypothetical protein OXG05_07120 [Gammaproteobacteria bacterium]|nr:hypothetical protein [Gammaproteobacteria bacterium]